MLELLQRVLWYIEEQNEYLKKLDALTDDRSSFFKQFHKDITEKIVCELNSLVSLSYFEDCEVSELHDSSSTTDFNGKYNPSSETETGVKFVPQDENPKVTVQQSPLEENGHVNLQNVNVILHTGTGTSVVNLQNQTRVVEYFAETSANTRETQTIIKHDANVQNGFEDFNLQTESHINHVKSQLKAITQNSDNVNLHFGNKKNNVNKFDNDDETKDLEGPIQIEEINNPQGIENKLFTTEGHLEELIVNHEETVLCNQTSSTTIESSDEVTISQIEENMESMNDAFNEVQLMETKIQENDVRSTENNTVVEIDVSSVVAIANQSPKSKAVVVYTSQDHSKKIRLACKYNDIVQCEICKKTMKAGYIRNHMNIHTGEKPFKCKHCDAKFANQGTLHYHTQVHSGNLPYKCPHCDSRYVKPSLLRNHMKSHYGEKPFACDLCDAKYCSKSNLSAHRYKHTGKNPYVCVACGRHFSFNTSLKRHEQTVHANELILVPSKRPRIPVRKQQESGVEKKLRMKKMRKKLKSIELPEANSVSYSRFKTINPLDLLPMDIINTSTEHDDNNNHKPKTKKKYIENNKKTSECQLADETLSVFCVSSKATADEKNAIFPYYKKKIDPNATKKCPVCDKLMKCTSMATHMRIHTGEKPYKCTHCDARFSNQGTLHYHTRTHTGDFPHKCSLCDAKFGKPSLLKGHMLSHTGEKPYECTQCDAKYSTPGGLKHHKKYHTGEKPFHCQQCDACYSQKHCLKRHMKSAHKID